MDPSQDFKSLQEGIQKFLVSTVKTINRIAAEDLTFQRTVNPDVAHQLDEKTSRILDLSTRLLQSAARACGTKAPKLEDAEDIDMHWRVVVDVVDSVLEKADTAMDEYTGLVKRKEPPSADATSKSKKPKSMTGKVIRNANVRKPQTDFDLQPANFPTGPWKPILTNKPHAKVPLDQSLVTCANDHGATQYKHPYEAEISSIKYPSRVFQSSVPIPPQPVETTTATWVDTYEGVLDMLQELKQAKEIAVDLEHHDFRTYVGLVSLMQISTREKDWIVDTLKPWRHKLEVLNQVFTDPSIVKVFHGAYMDMVWLQRDLGLYVNGLFDTYFACVLLLYSGRSLAFLLSKFVNFDADKQYQLADWRIRPIPAEMMYYARSDTHYLLYIYDRVRNELVEASDRRDPEKDLISRALQKSRDLSLSRYEHPDFNEETGEGSRGWYSYVIKNSHLAFNSEQFAVFRALWKWRDATARKEDESPIFVLGPSNVTEIARVNPPDAKALHSLLPLTAPLARSRLNEIWSQLQESKARGGPSLLHFFAAQAPESMRQNKSLPRIAKAQTQMPELGGEIAADRLPRSRLFGDVAISSRWEETKQTSAVQDDHFPFPWQRFVQDGSEMVVGSEQAGEIASAEEPKVEVLPPAAATEAAQDQDEEFTLRRGRKRKSEAMEEESGSNDSDSDSDGDEEMQDDADNVISIQDKAPQKTKKARKEKKKEGKDEKKAKKRQRAKLREERLTRKAQEKEKKKANEDEQKKYQAVPFDYTKAATVLHAKKGEVKETVQKEKKKVFDPYSKTGDNEIKGARRMPAVRGERSATFKK